MRLHELTEGRDAALFHFTRLHSLFGIVAGDSLGGAHGVSLTRDVNTPFFSHGFWNHVALVLDQRALSYNHAFEPKAGDVATSGGELFSKPGAHPSRAREAEEFVARPIAPLSRYLRQIVLGDNETTSKLVRYMRMQVAGRPMPKAYAGFAEMIRRQERGFDRKVDVLDPAQWSALFDYSAAHGIPVLLRPLRLTFGTQRANLWHRGLGDGS